MYITNNEVEFIISTGPFKIRYEKCFDEEFIKTARLNKPVFQKVARKFWIIKYRRFRFEYFVSTFDEKKWTK